ncbi:MAG: MerR family transcriptional regulator [Candidatus Zixiibacteriota bacterium]
MSIGQVARLSDVSVQTLRYYERQGCLKEVTRRSSGYRVYSYEHVQVVNFIKRAQVLGFTLTEIKDLIWLQNENTIDRKKVRSLAKEKIEDIKQRISNLKTILNTLIQLVDSCTNSNLNGKCPILETLNSGKKKGKSK